MAQARVGSRRGALGLTQLGLADLLEVDVRSVARYESGESTSRVARH